MIISRRAFVLGLALAVAAKLPLTAKLVAGIRAAIERERRRREIADLVQFQARKSVEAMARKIHQQWYGEIVNDQRIHALYINPTVLEDMQLRDL